MLSFEVYCGATRKLVAKVNATSEVHALVVAGVKGNGYYAVLAW